MSLGQSWEEAHSSLLDVKKIVALRRPEKIWNIPPMSSFSIASEQKNKQKKLVRKKKSSFQE